MSLHDNCVEKKYLEKDEIEVILQRTREEDPKHHLIFQTLWRTGLRVSELTDLIVGDIDFTGGKMRIENGVEDNFRWVPLDSQLRKGLKDYVDSNNLDGDDVLFDYTESGIRCLVEKYAGDEWIKPFTFRHSFAVHNLRSGVDPLQLMEILGLDSLDHIKSYIGISGCEPEIDLRDKVDFRSSVQKYGDYKTKLGVDFEKKSLDLLSELYFPEKQKEKIENRIFMALKNRRNIVLIGPPGTGKSKLAKIICRNYVGDRYKLVTATSNWSTRDTIGGYMDGQEKPYAFKPGVFLERFQDEYNNPNCEWLIVDEINRADIDRSFGCLFSALSGDNVTLPFRSHEGESIEIIGDLEKMGDLKVKDNRYFVPEDWRMIGTMNTYDKTSLHDMSYAFMRRLAFVPIDIPSRIDEELIERYTECWGLDYDEESANTLVDIWKEVNEYRKIGPAIIKDIYSYLLESDGDYISPIIMYVSPQLKGLKESEKINFVKSLRELSVGNQDYEEIKDHFSDYFDIKRCKFDEYIIR
ncbi:MAG: tyrosine-type recombinase/integrase [Thermoplasmatota archaeon]